MLLATVLHWLRRLRSLQQLLVPCVSSCLLHALLQVLQLLLWQVRHALLRRHKQLQQRLLTAAARWSLLVLALLLVGLLGPARQHLLPQHVHGSCLRGMLAAAAATGTAAALAPAAAGDSAADALLTL
jgi:hypothetical protein